jgi:hypothetical protein
MQRPAAQEVNVALKTVLTTIRRFSGLILIWVVNNCSADASAAAAPSSHIPQA